MAKTYIIVQLQVEGIHQFKTVDEHFEGVSFLKHPHRHIFHIKASKQVYHDDRDVEFILFKRSIHTLLKNSFADKDGVCQFGNLSCEQIARIIFEEFDCNFVEVWEDNENGARIEI